MNALLKSIFIAVALAAACSAASTISENGMVTFQLSYPNAKEVLLKGDWGGEPLPMTKDEQGVWTLDLTLKPQIYTYTFQVDGVRTLNLANAHYKLGRVVIANSVEVPGTPPKPWEISEVPHGDVVTITYNSKAAGDQRRITVYTPPGYQPDQAQKLPVLYLLHGNGGNERIWVDHGRAHLIADSLLAEGRMRPMVIVMPKGHAYPPGETEVDGVRPDSVFDQDLLETIMPLVEKRFRVKTGQPKRAVMGLSMGGGQAYRVGLGHLDLFSHVGIFSASGREPAILAALAEDPAYTNEKLKMLWIACGRLDRGFERVEAMIEDFSEAGIEHAYHVSEGAHTWINWREYLSETLPLLFQ